MKSNTIKLFLFVGLFGVSTLRAMDISQDQNLAKELASLCDYIRFKAILDGSVPDRARSFFQHKIETLTPWQQYGWAKVLIMAYVNLYRFGDAISFIDWMDAGTYVERRPLDDFLAEAMQAKMTYICRQQLSKQLKQ